MVMTLLPYLVPGVIPKDGTFHHHLLPLRLQERSDPPAPAPPAPPQLYSSCSCSCSCSAVQHLHPGQGHQLGLEHHRLLVSVDLHILEHLLAPLHLDLEAGHLVALLLCKDKEWWMEDEGGQWIKDGGR